MHAMANTPAMENPAERMKNLFCCFKVASRTEMCRRSAEDWSSGSHLLGGVYSGLGRGRGLFRYSSLIRPGAGRRMRKRNAKRGPLRRSPLHDDFAPVILNDLLHHRQAKTSPVLFSLADERLEQRIPDGTGDAAAVVTDPDFNSASSSAKLNFHPPGAGGQRLACIQQEIDECAFQLSVIKPTLDAPRLMDIYSGVVEFRAGLDRLYGGVQSAAQAAVGRPQGRPGAGELEQRINQLGHAVHSGAHFLVQVFALFTREMGFAQEFRVGDDCCQR